MTRAAFLTLAPVVLLWGTGCATTLVTGRLEVVHDETLDRTTVQSATLFLEQGDELTTLKFRWACAGGACSEPERVVAVIRTRSSSLIHPPRVALSVGDWQQELKILRLDPTPLIVGYAYSVEVELSMGLLYKLASAPHAQIGLTAHAAELSPDHQAYVEEFAARVTALSKERRLLARRD